MTALGDDATLPGPVNPITSRALSIVFPLYFIMVGTRVRIVRHTPGHLQYNRVGNKHKGLKQ